MFTNANASTLALGGTYAGPAANTFAPAITDNGPLPTTVAVNGSLWTLTGGNNNTFTGGVVLNGGTLNVTSNNQLQSNLVSVYGGNLAFAAGVTSGTLGGLGGNAGRIVLQDANSSARHVVRGRQRQQHRLRWHADRPRRTVQDRKRYAHAFREPKLLRPTVVNGGTLQISTPAAPSGFGGNGAGWTLKNAWQFGRRRLQRRVNADAERHREYGYRAVVQHAAAVGRHAVDGQLHLQRLQRQRGGWRFSRVADLDLRRERPRRQRGQQGHFGYHPIGRTRLEYFQHQHRLDRLQDGGGVTTTGGRLCV